MSLLPFTHPFTSVIAGPTSSGKTVFVRKLLDLRSTHIDPKPDSIIYYYTEWQPIYDEIKGVTFKKEVPQLEDFTGEKKTLIIVDDMMNECRLGNFFTKGSHHRNLSVIFIVQNLFNRARDQRTINLNCQYLILFKNPRDILQIEYLGRSIMGREFHDFVSAYKSATSNAFGYLLVDLKQETPDNIRLRTYILNDHPLDRRYIGVYYPIE